MFAFTSMGGKQDKSVNTGRGPYCYRIQGMNYHRMGSFLPDEGKPPMFSQLYIYDTENEVQNRIKFASNGETTSSGKKKIDHQLTTEIRDMLDTNNPLERDGFDSMEHKRDIILERQGGNLKQISELHPSYLALQYPLLFSYAQDGYCTNIYHHGVTDMIVCLMLGSMSPELQRDLENYKAYDMIQELKPMFEEQAKQELFEIVKAFHACK
ncbi:hypothetical protein Tco_0962395 [Tanacetum coccineum]